VIAKEMLGPILLSLHNTAFYQRLVRQLRESIVHGRLSEFRSNQLARWNPQT
jgi:queuine tRNA-ribosyltransferase